MNLRIVVTHELMLSYMCGRMVRICMFHFHLISGLNPWSFDTLLLIDSHLYMDFFSLLFLLMRLLYQFNLRSTLFMRLYVVY